VWAAERELGQAGRGEGSAGWAGPQGGWGGFPLFISSSFMCLFFFFPFYLSLVLVLNSKYTMPYESMWMHNKAQSSKNRCSSNVQ
jgi:hypothetical protein